MCKVQQNGIKDYLHYNEKYIYKLDKTWMSSPSTQKKTLHNKLVSSMCKIRNIIKSYAEMFSEHVIAKIKKKKTIFKQPYSANFTTYSGKMCVGLHYIMQIMCVL